MPATETHNLTAYDYAAAVVEAENDRSRVMKAAIAKFAEAGDDGIHPDFKEAAAQLLLLEASRASDVYSDAVVRAGLQFLSEGAGVPR